MFFLKLLLKNLIRVNKNVKFNGCPLIHTLEADAKSLEDFLENILLKRHEEARGVIITLIPIILRINLNVYTIYPREHTREDVCDIYIYIYIYIGAKG